MPALSTLKLSVASPRTQLSPVARKRRKLIEQIDLQRKAADAAILGDEFFQQVKRWERVEGTEEKHLLEVSKPVRRWWWTNDVGAIMFSVRQGSRILEIADGKQSVEVGELKDLPKVLQTLREAIVAGELDGQLGKTTFARPVRKAKPTKS
jgi:uncharacterized protein YabN with tetrapyrrole methylase and pyrophosphatase domain